MSISFRLPRRTPKPAPKHGPKRFADPGATMHVVEDEAAAPAEPEETPAVRPLPVPEFGVPAEWPPASPRPASREVLERVADRLRALPALPGAYLCNITPGDKPNPHEALTGYPSCAGTRRLADGTPVAGLYLSEGDLLGRHVLDIPDVVWLGRLIDAAEEARERLYALQAPGLDEGAEGGAAA